MIKKMLQAPVKILCVCAIIVCESTTFISSQPSSTDDALSFQIDTNSQTFSKLNCLILCVGKSTTLETLGKIVKYDLEFTDQLNIDLKKADVEPEATVLSKLFDKGTSLYLMLKEGKGTKTGKEIEALLKEPSTQSTLFSKRFFCNEDNITHSGHLITNDLFPVLTGQNAPVLSTLAFCVQTSPTSKCLWITDYSGQKKRKLFDSNTINVAPRWHTKVPMLFYSQFTHANTRLMSFDLKANKRHIVCSYDGLNMQPSFSQDGIQAVLCLSAAQGNSEIFLYDQKECNRTGKKVFTQLTKNGGSNASPCLLPNNDIIFCSDFETGSPQIYYLDRKSNTTKRLTNGKGYCAAPSYSKANNAIVYCRFLKGTFQLFSLKLDDPQHIERQLTTGLGDKQEPVWSDCGRFIAFSYDCKDKESGKKASQIAILNMNSKKIRVLTTGKEQKSFPCWVNEPYYA